MSRVDNWEIALADALTKAEAVPFSWQCGGCVGLAIDCAEAITGKAPLEKPVLSDALDAKRWLKKSGHADLADAVAAHLEEIPVAFAGRGDIGIVDRDGSQTAAVCAGLYWLARSEAGLVRVSRAEIKRAFRV